jgi:hypothetical protein
VRKILGIDIEKKKEERKQKERDEKVLCHKFLLLLHFCSWYSRLILPFLSPFFPGKARKNRRI